MGLSRCNNFSISNKKTPFEANINFLLRLQPLQPQLQLRVQLQQQLQLQLPLQPQLQLQVQLQQLQLQPKMKRNRFFSGTKAAGTEVEKKSDQSKESFSVGLLKYENEEQTEI